MLVGRVTSQQLYGTSQQSLALVKSRLSTLQQQASDGRAILKPSDDPAGTAAILQLRAGLAANTQYRTNIGDGLAWATTTDSALTAAEGLVRQAKDLTIQAANASSGANGREAVAVQLESLKADLLGQANTRYLGRSVFAGTSDAGAAFASDGAYAGVLDAAGAAVAVHRRISGTETVTVSADGAAAFGSTTAGTSVFAALDRIVAALRDPGYDAAASTAPTTVRAGIDDLQASFGRLTAEHSVVGNAYSRLDGAKSRNLDVATTLEQQRSSIQDVDQTKVLLDLKTQELAYQTALGVTAQVLQPTLMSFLR